MKENHHGVVGHLAEDSPLKKVFPDGRVPLAGSQPHQAQCGDEPGSPVESVYLIAVRACTDEEVYAMAQLMDELGQGPTNDAMHHLATTDTVPVRSKNLVGFALPGSR